MVAPCLTHTCFQVSAVSGTARARQFRTRFLAERSSARAGAANSRYFTGPDGRRIWRSAPGFGPFAAGSGVESPPLAVAGLLPVTTGSWRSRQPLHDNPAIATLAHNNSFKPNPLRGSA